MSYLRLSTPRVLYAAGLGFTLLCQPGLKAQDQDTPSYDSGRDTSTNAAPPSERMPTPMEEIIVTGTRQETEIIKAPADVSVITETELRKPGISGYQEAIRSVPGVKINARQGGDPATPGIELRGLESNPTSGGNVLMLLDGIPQRRLSFGGPYVGGLPYDALARMELVKGPSSSLYGRGAMAGALQLFTSPGTATWEVQTWNTVESTVDRAKTAWRVSGPLDSTRGATFALTGAGGYADGWQPNTDGAQGNAYLHARVPLTTQDTLSVMGGYFQGYQNMAAPVLIDRQGERLPGIDRDENLSVPGQNSLDLAEARAGLAWERDWTDQLKSKATFGYWRGDTDWKVGRPDDRPAAGTILSRPTSNRPWNEDSVFAELQASRDYTLTENLTGALIGGASLEYATFYNEQQNIWSPGGSPSTGIPLDLNNRVEPDPSTWIYGPWGRRDTSEWDPGVFLKNRLSFWDRVNLEGGGRVDWYQRHQENLVSGNASTVQGDAFSPNVGASVQLLKTDAHVLAAYAAWGLGFSPVYRSVGTTEIVDLQPETSQSYEAGLKSSLFQGKVEGTVAFYRQERNDVVGSLSSTVTTNIGDWEIDGMELGVKARPVSGLSMYGNYTHRLPRIARDMTDARNEGNRIPFVAEDLFSVGSEYQFASGWFAGLDNHFVGPSFVDNLNAVHLGSYHLMTLFAGLRWKKLEVSTFVNNLLDEEYFSAVFNGVRNGSAFEGTPRSFGMTLSYRF